MVLTNMVRRSAACVSLAVAQALHTRCDRGVRFGVVADVQYCDIDDARNFAGTEVRFYRGSLDGARRDHGVFDAHATATVVVSLCEPEDYVGGYYAQPSANASSARYASLDVGDAFCHGHDLRHGVRVLSGARYSLVLWFTPRAHHQSALAFT